MISARRIILALALASVTAGALGQTAPTTTTAPAFTPDLSSPRAAAKSLAHAVALSDLNALRQVIHATDDPHRHLADAYAAVIISGQRLAAAMELQFGAGAGSTDRGLPTDEELDAIDAAALRVSGNSATIKLPGRGDKPLALQRDETGQWHVDLLAFANVSDTDPASQCLMQLNLASELNALAAEISTGRYRTAADARAAVQDRVHGTIAKSMRSAAASRPVATSRPTTVPSTSP